MTIREYTDLDVVIEKLPEGYVARILGGPLGLDSAPFVLPFNAPELAQFMLAVGPPRVASRRLVPAVSREVGVRDYGRRLNESLFAGNIGNCFRQSLTQARAEGKDLRIRLRLSAVPELDSIPWEYLFDTELDRFLALSNETPIVRYLDSAAQPHGLTVEPPLRVLAMISNPSDTSTLDVAREKELLKATTADLVASGLLELVFLEDATLIGLQHALYDRFHVFHFVGHGGFDDAEGEGVLVLENESGTSHRVSGSRLGTLLHDAEDLQLAVINACEGARTSGQDAFSGVGQTLVRQGLPAVVAMQVEISDRAALAFSHEFYFAMSRGKPIEAAMCEVRKAMATSDAASEWGTPVLLRSAAEQPFVLSAGSQVASPGREQRWESLYAAAGQALSTGAATTALPILEQLAMEKPGYQDVNALLSRVRPRADMDSKAAESTGAVESEAPPWPLSESGKGIGSAKPTMTEAKPTMTEAKPMPWLAHPPDAPPIEVPRPAGPARTSWVKIGVAAAALVLVGTMYAIFASQTDTTSGTSTGSSNGTSSTALMAVAVAQACGPTADIPGVDNSFTADCTVVRPNIDGSFSEWEGGEHMTSDTEVFPKPSTSADLQAQWRLTWNKDALYLHARVQDPFLRPVEVNQPGQFFRGDSVSFEFGPDPRDLSLSAGLREGEDLHLMLGLTQDGFAASANPAQSTGSKIAFVSGELVGDVEVKGQVFQGGYELEAAVPWWVLNVDDPTQGDVFGMNLNVSDAADEGSWSLVAMISSNADRTAANQPRPGTWQRLVLTTVAAS